MSFDLLKALLLKPLAWTLVLLPPPLQHIIWVPVPLPPGPWWLPGPPPSRLPASLSDSDHIKPETRGNLAAFYCPQSLPLAISTPPAALGSTSALCLPASPRVQQISAKSDLVKLVEFRLNPGGARSSLRVALRSEPINKATHKKLNYHLDW